MAIEGELSVPDPEKFKLIKGNLPLEAGHASVYLDDDNGHVIFDVGQDRVQLFGYSAYGAGKVTIVDRSFGMQVQVLEELIRYGKTFSFDRPNYSLFLHNKNVDTLPYHPSKARLLLLGEDVKED